MSGLPSWLLAGEVCRVNVEVFNCGQVALNSLRLASSLSQHLLLEEVCICTSVLVLATSPDIQILLHTGTRAQVGTLRLP